MERRCDAQQKLFRFGLQILEPLWNRAGLKILPRPRARVHNQSPAHVRPTFFLLFCIASFCSMLFESGINRTSVRVARASSSIHINGQQGPGHGCNPGAPTAPRWQVPPYWTIDYVITGFSSSVSGCGDTFTDGEYSFYGTINTCITPCATHRDGGSFSFSVRECSGSMISGRCTDHSWHPGMGVRCGILGELLCLPIGRRLQS